MNSNLNWKLIGTITSYTGSLTIPEGAKEVYVEIALQPLSNSSILGFDFTKIRDDFLTTNSHIDGFYYSSKYYGTICITISNTTIKFDTNWTTIYWNGATVALSSMSLVKMRAYYR